MIKKVSIYFLLAASMLIITPQVKTNFQDEPTLTENAIIEDIDPNEPGYDHLDYLADQPETEKHHSRMPDWVVALIGPLYVKMLIHCGKAHDYCAKKWLALKRTLAR